MLPISGNIIICFAPITILNTNYDPALPSLQQRRRIHYRPPPPPTSFSHHISGRFAKGSHISIKCFSISPLIHPADDYGMFLHAGTLEKCVFVDPHKFIIDNVCGGEIESRSTHFQLLSFCVGRSLEHQRVRGSNQSRE